MDDVQARQWQKNNLPVQYNHPIQENVSSDILQTGINNCVMYKMSKGR